MRLPVVFVWCLALAGCGGVSPDDLAGAVDLGDLAEPDADMAPAADLRDGAAAAAAVLILPTAFDFGAQPVGSSTDHSLVVINSGAVAASAVTVGALAAPFSLESSDCVATLAPAGSCTLVVRFSPTVDGDAAAVLSIGYHDGSSDQTASVSLAGTGSDRAALSLSDAPDFLFGLHATGSTHQHIFTLTNGGGSAASMLTPTAMAAPFGFAGGAYPGLGGTCGGSLAPAATCTLAVAFSPTASGSFAGALTIGYQDGAGSLEASVALSGSGAAPALVAISDGPLYDFGTLAVGKSTSHFFYLSNSGGLAVSTLALSGLAAPFTFQGGVYPGAGGSCGAALDAGSTCTIAVSFSPVAALTSSGTLVVDYADADTAHSTTRDFSGSGTTLGHLVISDFPSAYYTQYGLPPDGASFDFTSVGVGRLATHTFYVTNSGGGPASALSGAALSSAVFAYQGGGGAPGQGGSCSGTLAAGASCTLVVGFTPVAAVGYSDAIGLSYNDGAALQSATRALSGSGTSGASLTLTDYQGVSFGTAFDYGTLGVNQSADHTFYVGNSGAVSATMLSGGAFGAGFLWKGGAFPGDGGTCAGSLAADGSCSVVVRFAPVDTQPAEDTVTLNYFDGASTRSATRNIVGLGTALPLLQVSAGGGGPQPLYDWGARGLGSSTDAAFVVANLGGADASSVVISASGAPFAVESSVCPATLAPGASCNVVAAFSPTAAGIFYGDLQAAFSGGTASRALLGSGTAAAFLLVSDEADGSGDSSVDFGTVGTNGQSTRMIYLTNRGGGSASGVSIAALSAPFAIVANPCGATLAAGASCQLSLSFSPSSAAAFATTLQVAYSDGTSLQAAAAALTGSATADALLSFSDSQFGGSANGPFDFGVAGSAVTHTFYLFNEGPQAATALTPSGLTAPFAISANSCGATLAAGASCSLTVSFSPTGSGSFTQSLTLAYGDSGGAQTPIARAVTGTGSADAVVTINPQIAAPQVGPARYDFGASGIAVSHPLYLFPSGAQSATGLSVDPLVAPLSIASDGCSGSPLAAGASCSVVVAFSPSAAGAVSQTLSAHYRDSIGAQPAATALLSATGTLDALLTIDDLDGGCPGCGPYDFGTAGLPMTHSLMISNLGGADATSVVLSGLSAPYSITQNLCGSSVAKGSQCTLTVTFAPTATGTFAQTLTVGYSDAVGAQPSISRAFTGVGTRDALLAIVDNPGGGVSGGAFDFGTAGQPIDHSFSVVNNGPTQATGLTLRALGAGFSIKQNSCGATLGSSASCTIDVLFTPPGAGSFPTTLALGYSDSSGAQPDATRALQATGTTGAFLTVDDCQNCGQPPGVFDFGTAGIAVTHTFYLTNHGALDATSVTLGGLSSPLSLPANSCATVAAGASCPFDVRFSLPSNAVVAQTLSAGYLSNGVAQTPVTRALTGTGTASAYLAIADFPGNPPCVNCGPYDFGSSGVPTTHTFTVENLGASPATQIVVGSLPSPFAVITNGCSGGTLVAGASCTLTVQFGSPVTRAYQQTLSIAYDDGASPQPPATRALAGTGDGDALVTLRADGEGAGCPGCTPPPLDFGVWGVPTTRNFVLFNSGAADATALFFGGLSSPFAVTANTCVNNSVPSNSSCQLTVTFTPSGNGVSSQTLTASYSDSSGARPAATRALTGTATSRALVLVSDGGGGQSAWDFGAWGVGNPLVASHTFTLSNQGGSDTTAATLASGISGAFSISADGCSGAALPTGKSCNLTVVFAPGAAGSVSQSLSFAYADGGGALEPAARAVTGTGTLQARLLVEDYPYPPQGGPPPGPDNPFQFGVWGVSHTHTFTVYNVGGGATTSLADGGTLSGGFAFVAGSCSSPLAAGASCTVGARFTPTGNSLSSSLLTLAYGDGVSAESATRSLAASSTTRAFLVISDNGTPETCGDACGPFYFPSISLGDPPAGASLSVFNTGALATSAAPGIGSIEAPFSAAAGTCTGPVAAGGSCVLSASFAPQTKGTFDTALSLSYDDGSGPTLTTARNLEGSAF